ALFEKFVNALRVSSSLVGEALQIAGLPAGTRAAAHRRKFDRRDLFDLPARADNASALLGFRRRLLGARSLFALTCFLLNRFCLRFGRLALLFFLFVVSRHGRESTTDRWRTHMHRNGGANLHCLQTISTLLFRSIFFFMRSPDIAIGFIWYVTFLF